MPDHQPLRRRSPLWVRRWTSEQLHAVVFKLSRERMSQDLSDRQERLHDAIVSELEYRRRQGRWKLCTCVYCQPRLPLGRSD